MTLALEQTKTFKKCLKKYKHEKDVMAELKKIIALLVNDKPIPAKYRDHELKGNYKGIRELHLKPDDLLLYIKIEGEKVILMALGSHSDIF
jgi:mRNA interferase YafQ